MTVDDTSYSVFAVDHDPGAKTMAATIPQLSNLGQLPGRARGALSANRLGLARSLCVQGLTRFPDSADLLAILGWVHAKDSDYAAAERCFRRSLSGDENLAEAHSGLGAVLAIGGNYAEAAASYRHSLERSPHAAPTWFNYGCSLRALGRLDEAIDAFRRAVHLDPQMADAHRNVGIAFGQQGKWKQTLRSCKRALRPDPTWPEARLLRAMAHLSMGSFAEGWDDYEARTELSESHPGFVHLPFWKGPGDAKRSIAVVPEQGVGTEIMFASCLGDLASCAAHCTVGCDARLVSLLGRSYPATGVVDVATLNRLAKRGRFDCYLMAGSLPRMFRRARSDFPGGAYLLADRAASGRWHARLSALGSGLKVGISWRGGAAAHDAGHRSTQPQDWKTLLRLPGIAWVNLQYDTDRHELADWELAAGRKIHDWDDLDQRSDFENMAGLIGQLDLVISVANSTVHLAGALGVPTWTLLPWAVDWRWQARGATCVWHDSVRLIRQRAEEDWTGVFGRVVRRLAAFRDAARRRRA